MGLATGPFIEDQVAGILGQVNRTGCLNWDLYSLECVTPTFEPIWDGQNIMVTKYGYWQEVSWKSEPNLVLFSLPPSPPSGILEGLHKLPTILQRSSKSHLLLPINEHHPVCTGRRGPDLERWPSVITGGHHARLKPLCFLCSWHSSLF